MNIKDIAKLANVSKSTVSRVLNNTASVNEEMRQRVLSVIEETGYKPNALAKELVIKETRLIGVIVPRINTSVFSDIIEGIMHYLADKGYNVILQCSKANEEEEIRQFEFLQKKRVDGIIFFPGNMTPRLREVIRKLDTPLVILGLDDPQISRSAVLFDEYGATRAMIDYFLSTGHTHIAFIGIDPQLSPVGGERKRGYMDALLQNGTNINPDYIFEGSFDLSSGFEGTQFIFEKNTVHPTAIFTSTDYLAIGAIKYLRKTQHSIPDDVSVSGFDGIEISSYFYPTVTTVQFDYYHSGEVSARFILESIKNPFTFHKHTLGYQILHRDSTL